jgi:hypothetical protein
VHYNEKEYKCNKNIPDLKIFLFGIYLNVISMRYIQKASGDHIKVARDVRGRGMPEKKLLAMLLVWLS